jgi:hypothetical protein
MGAAFDPQNPRKKARHRAGETAQQLRQLAALAKNQNLVPTSGTELQLRGPNTVLKPPPCTHVCLPTYAHTYTNKFKYGFLKKNLGVVVAGGIRDR